jgi:hypothetical protein
VDPYRRDIGCEIVPVELALKSLPAHALLRIGLEASAVDTS